MAARKGQPGGAGVRQCRLCGVDELLELRATATIEVDAGEDLCGRMSLDVHIKRLETQAGGAPGGARSAMPDDTADRNAIAGARV